MDKNLILSWAIKHNQIGVIKALGYELEDQLKCRATSGFYKVKLLEKYQVKTFTATIKYMLGEWFYVE